MDKSFINKVKLTILEHIEDETFSVGDLASKIGFSKSQTLRKIRVSTGKSANQFIREIRLEEAAKLIRNNEYTASEVAYKVGFGSPSYFNKCFHDYFGVTPGEYKELDQEKIQEIANKPNPIDTNLFKKIKIHFSIITLLIVVLSILFFINRNYIRKNKLQNSIAVLYFDDMSSDSDTQWFCDGITDEINTNLSKLKNLKVISRTSVKRYKNSDKSIPKIAKELGVLYILEGSVKKHSNKFRITVKLINRNEETVWSQEYDEEIENMLETQREMSNEIVKQLHLVINPEEEKRLRQVPTDNFEAYKYYLRARNFAEKGTKEYFDLSIIFYQYAIDLDPNFANAYAEMGLTYLNNRYVDDPLNWDQSKNKASLLVDKALKIDPNCGKAYAAKAKLNYKNKKQNEVIDNFQMALKLNPNDALIHRDMAQYYSDPIVRDFNKSLYHINKAVELDPFSASIHFRKIRILTRYNMLSEAKKFYENNITLFSDKIKFDIQNHFIRSEANKTGIEKKDRVETFKFLDQKIKEDPQNSYIYLELGAYYNEVLNDNLNYIKYTKKAYSLDSVNWENGWDYFLALLKDKKFTTAEKLMNSKKYRDLMSDSQLLHLLSRYYYHKENYDEALKIANDPSMKMNHSIKILILAQKEDVKGVRKILNNTHIHDLEKIKVFAILKERDSMYYYIDKRRHNIVMINGSNEINPYRKEERYKELLKKNYLPITHWNE